MTKRSTQSRQMGRDRVSVISYFIMLLLKCRDFATVEATRGFPLAHRPLRRVLPCFLFFPAACLFLRHADSHRWTRWGIGAVAAAVGILPARAFRRIPANFLPLKQPASCHPPLGLRTAKSPSLSAKFYQTTCQTYPSMIKFCQKETICAKCARFTRREIF